MEKNAACQFITKIKEKKKRNERKKEISIQLF